MRKLLRGRKVESVGVMKDTELKLEEIEASRTLGGAGEGRHAAAYKTPFQTPKTVESGPSCAYFTAKQVELVAQLCEGHDDHIIGRSVVIPNRC